MALNGTLSDLGIVDLIQFPNAGHKTGELIVSGEEDEARLYYAKGNLQHIFIGDRKGMEALVELVSWDKGRFEFRLGIEQKERSLNIDLHQALMYALKTRDEKTASDHKNSVKAERYNGWKDRLKKHFEEYLFANVYLQGICLLSTDGAAIVEVVGKETTKEDFDKLKEYIYHIKETYPRTGISRMLLDGASGIVCSTCLSNGATVIIVTNKEASLGAVSVNASKLSSIIEGMKS